MNSGGEDEDEASSKGEHFGVFLPPLPVPDISEVVVADHPQNEDSA